MITISGIEVNPGGTTAPSLYDIGYGLAAIIRFGGHVKRPWSVLEHSYACCYYAEYCHDALAIVLQALIHDAHETVTGDVVRPWKPVELSIDQDELDRRIWEVHSLPVPDAATLARVKEIDNMILLAEKKMIAPQYDIQEPIDERAIRAIYKTQAHISYHTVHTIATDYAELVSSLREKVHGSATTGQVPELQQTLER